MIAGPFKDRVDTLAHSAAVPEPILTSAALYGANASGKTNVLRALHFMTSAVSFSHTRWLPNEAIEREPFASTPDQDRPSEFSADFVLEEVRYQYGFSVSDTAVLEEWLHAYPKGKRQAWFSRRTGEPMSFSQKMAGDNRTIEGLMRPNSLFLSTAAQNNHPALSSVYRWFSDSLDFVIGGRTRSMHRATELCADPQYRDSIVSMVTRADLGIADLRLKDEHMPEETKRMVLALATFLKSELKLDKPLPRVDEEHKEIQFLHRLGDQLVPFSPGQESDGTRAYLALLGPIVLAIRNGGVICVDELDSSLHPLLALNLIRLFSEKSLNPKGAQLIFNTHDTNLLSGSVLRRDQIWFAEKKQDGSSQIYPLSDFKPRKEENLTNGYLQGRYGAIPFLNPDCLPSTRGTEHDEA